MKGPVPPGVPRIQGDEQVTRLIRHFQTAIRRPEMTTQRCREGSPACKNGKIHEPIYSNKCRRKRSIAKAGAQIS